MEVNQCPFAVPRVDAQSQLHLFIKHHKDFYSLLLWKQIVDIEINTFRLIWAEIFIYNINKLVSLGLK